MVAADRAASEYRAANDIEGLLKTQGHSRTLTSVSGAIIVL